MYSDEFTVTQEDRIEEKLDQLLSERVGFAHGLADPEKLKEITSPIKIDLKFTQQEIEILNRKSADDATHFRNDMLYVKLRGTWYFYCNSYWHESMGKFNENSLCPILKGE